MRAELGALVFAEGELYFSSATLKKEFVKNHCIMQSALKKTLAQNAAKINNRLKKVLNCKTLADLLNKNCKSVALGLTIHCSNARARKYGHRA